MSKPLPANGPAPQLAPDEQIAQFAALYRRAVNPVALAWFSARVRNLGLRFSDDELVILAALNTPARVQDFLDAQIYYNYDHSAPDQEETCHPPRRVLQTAHAHCFEGALFAYAVNYLHSHNPRMVLLEASQDSEHNLVLFEENGLYGAVAHSGYANLGGRPARFATIRALAESYVPYYYSDYTLDPRDLTLVGYSDPFELIQEYGVAWIASDEPLWEIYYTFVDDSTTFHYLFDDSPATHAYPLIVALQRGWIQVNGDGSARVSVADFPPAAQEVWHAFWRVFRREEVRPRGQAREIEKEFWRVMQTTPLDLEENAREVEKMSRAGYGVERLVRRLR